jgi:long-chain acyl-CoA synthetase
VALYLRERVGLEPGQRVALISELRPEWLVADLASLGLGAVSAAIDPGLEGAALATALEDAAPSVTFVSNTARCRLERLDGRAPPLGELVTLDPSLAATRGLSFHHLLDQGGTLDTPERAQAYRACAREVPPERAAVRQYRQAVDGGWERLTWSQAEVIARLRAWWLREPALPGDLAYLGDPTVPAAARLALYAFVGDGLTITAVGAGAGGLDDVAALRPTKLVLPPEVLGAAVQAGLARANGRLYRARRVRQAIREVLGGRVRRIGPTNPLDQAFAERLGAVAAVEPVSH